MPNDTPEAAAIRAYMDTTLDKILPTLGNLYGRWLDEQEYEDIKDYGDVIKKTLPEGLTMLKMTKRPFGFQCEAPEFPARMFAITMTVTAVKWKVIA